MAGKKARRKRGSEKLGKGASSEPDLSSSEFYLNRELTWLAFNDRVLLEAADERTPLLERLKFIAIVGSNLDEFFMKRVGGLKQQVGAGVKTLTVDGRSPQQQIDECYAVVRHSVSRQQACLRKVIEALAKEGIALTSRDRLSKKKQALLREHYVANIYPLVTPQAVDPAHPFPFISNLSLNFLVTLHHPKDMVSHQARVKVPVGAGIPRLLQVGSEQTFVPLEEVMAANLDLLFPGMEIESAECFRVTRNANTERDEEQADDLLALIETELRDRKFAPIVRLEVEKGMMPVHIGMLAAELGLDEDSDVFEVNGMLGTRDLMEIAGLDHPNLHEPDRHPVDHPGLISQRNIFNIIREAGSILLHHPYQSFSTSVERFLREASLDPKVRAIKMTLYRTSEDSRLMHFLMQAARNQKQVAVVVELKARFDEEANIRWAARLEELGVHVTYGVLGLKTHSKVILVVRQDYDGLRRYAHLATGNYHEQTARIYSDLGMLTCDEDIGSDLTEFFNYLTTGYKPRRNYRKILPAPTHLKRSLLDKIKREIKLHKSGSPGLIQMKSNALEDADITRSLYEASRAGVKVDLIVRDSCRLRPGAPGLSETVTVISIIGRFLEHSRIIYFRNGGDEEYYIGSADCMKRNLESRIELMVPVEDSNDRRRLRLVLDTQLADSRCGWEMGPDGTYSRRESGNEKSSKGSQMILFEAAEREYGKATQLRRRRAKGPSGRNLKDLSLTRAVKRQVNE